MMCMSESTKRRPSFMSSSCGVTERAGSPLGSAFVRTIAGGCAESSAAVVGCRPQMRDGYGAVRGAAVIYENDHLCFATGEAVQRRRAGGGARRARLGELDARIGRRPTPW